MQCRRHLINVGQMFTLEQPMSSPMHRKYCARTPCVSLCKTFAFNCANFPPGPETPSIFLCSTICLFQCDILLCDTHPLKNQRPNICTKQYLLTKKLHIVLAFRQRMIYAPLGTRKSKLYTTNKIKCNSFSTTRQKDFRLL